jgi:hypothetical protein
LDASCGEPAAPESDGGASDDCSKRGFFADIIKCCGPPVPGEVAGEAVAARLRFVGPLVPCKVDEESEFCVWPDPCTAGCAEVGAGESDMIDFFFKWLWICWNLCRKTRLVTTKKEGGGNRKRRKHLLVSLVSADSTFGSQNTI